MYVYFNDVIRLEFRTPVTREELLAVNVSSGERHMASLDAAYVVHVQLGGGARGASVRDILKPQGKLETLVDTRLWGREKEGSN